MPRPIFDPQRIAHWDTIIDEDPMIADTFKTSTVLRDVLYAGLYLSEELLALGCEPHLAVQIQFTHGYASFGNDPWEKAEELLRAFRNDELEFALDPSLEN
jgi:hypothetical protein